MKNKIKFIVCTLIFFTLLFASAYASTSDAVAREYYMQMYGNIYPNFNSPYKIIEQEAVVNETSGALCTNVTDYKILGKNGFDASVIRSFNTISTEGDISYREYSEDKHLGRCYKMYFVCSRDGETIPVYFDNEEQLFQAGTSFEGEYYKKASLYGEYWYTFMREEGTGVYYTLEDPSALPEIETDRLSIETIPMGISLDDAFIIFENETRISKPSMVFYGNMRVDDDFYYDFIFQDLNGETYFFTIVFNDETGVDVFDDTIDYAGSPRTKYQMRMPDGQVSLTPTIHTMGFEYNCYLESDQGIKYFLNGGGNGYDVVGAEDSYGNGYIIDVNDEDFSITTYDGVAYNVSANGVTKQFEDEITELVKYESQTVNNPQDEYNKFEIDDEYIFTVTKNSGTTGAILETEEDITRYYIKKDFKYDEFMRGGYLCTYELPYKVELPSGLTKHIEYTPIDWAVSSIYSDYIDYGYHYPVTRYYETDPLGNIKNESTYTYETEKVSKRQHITEVLRKDLSEGSVYKKTESRLDDLGRVDTMEVSLNYSTYDTYEYEYDSYYAGAPVTKITQSACFNNYNKGEHIHRYSYLDEYYIVRDRHEDYVADYTYYTDANYIPHETTYQTDDNTTIRIVNTLTDDNKSIAKTDYYKNDVLEKSTSYTYDTYGNVASQTSIIDDNTSLVTHYSYTYAPDGGYILTQSSAGLKDADGNPLPDAVTVSVYDDRGNLLSHTDANGNTTTMTYDNANRLLTAVYPDGTSDSYSYNISDGITTYTAPNGTVYKAYYNAWTNPIKTSVLINGAETILDEYQYDDRSNVVLYKRYLNDTDFAKAEYTYDYLDRVLTEKLYDGDTLVKTTTYEYSKKKDSSDRPVDVVTAQVSGDNGTYAKYTQSSNYRGYLLKQEAVSGNTERVTTYVNDYIGNPVSVTDNMGNTTITEYNSLNNPVKVTYADGTSVQTNYNLAGLTDSTVDAMGNTTSYVYDSLGRVVCTTAPFDSQNTSCVKTYYDPNGNVISARTLSSLNTEEEKYTTVTNSYDSRNRLINTAVYPDEESAIYTRYEYDTMGNPTKVVSGLTSAAAPDSEGQVVTYSYDALGRMISTTTPDALTETAHYDLAGRLVQSTDKAGRNTVFTYDIFDNITNTQKGDSTVSYTYNLLGNRTSMTDDTGLTTYTYNPFGELTQECIGSIIKSYTYDDLGRRTGLDISDGEEQILSQTYTYDNVGRLISLANGNDTVSYTYDDNSNMLTSAYNGTTYKTYMYNNANLPVYASLDYEGTTDSTNYVYTPDGNLFMSVGTNQMSMYYYDGANRLVHENTTLNGGTYSDTFSYDTFGNRVALTHNGFADNTTENTAYTYNSINQLVSKTDNAGTTNYTYDAVGNMTSVTANGQTEKAYTYDDFNRLATANVNGVTSSYTYNGDNLRQTKTVNGVTTRHIYDGSDIVADIGTDTTTFVRGNGLALLKNSTATQLYGIGRRGDVEHLISPNGTDNLYTYTAYGVATGDNNHIHNPFGYAGEYTDAETGLIYLRNRYYDAELGRFITQDPIKDGLNWYAYCSGNPVMFVDPLGYSISLDDDRYWDLTKNELQSLTDDTLEIDKSGKVMITSYADANNLKRPLGTELIRALISNQNYDLKITRNPTTGTQFKRGRAQTGGSININDEINSSTSENIYVINDKKEVKLISLSQVEPNIFLAHELIHSYNHMQGTFNDKPYGKHYYRYNGKSCVEIIREYQQNDEYETVGLDYVCFEYPKDRDTYRFINIYYVPHNYNKITENSIRQEQAVYNNKEVWYRYAYNTVKE